VIFATVGTHQQPMSRLMDALSHLANEHPELGPFVIQHGSSAMPATWSGRPMMSRHDMAELLGTSSIVITHCGPATIAEARALGQIPIVVPRAKARGEHVDDHQVRYARRLADLREIILVEDPTDLQGAVLNYGAAIRGLPPATAHDPAAAISAFEVAVSSLG
jgi:UDP-N-acetylglucosamine transferase subunit ALG13